MKVRKWSLVCCLIGLVVFLGACSSSSSEKSKSEKEIVFWNPFTGADNSNIKAMVDEYNKTNPEYKVKNVSMKETDLYTKIPTVVNSGKNIPDVTIVHGERIRQFKDNDMLDSLNQLLEGFPEIKQENYVEAAWNIGELDGERYSVPLDIHNWGTYYNKELLEKYAPEVIESKLLTVNKINEIGKAAQKDQIVTIGQSWVKPNFLSYMKQEGGKLTENGVEPTLDTEASVKAMDILHNYLEEGISTKDGEDPYQMFLSGKLIFLPEGIWMMNNIKNAKFEWGMINSPQVSEDPESLVNWASSHQFVLFKSKERDEGKSKGVVEFINWIRDHSMEWAKAGQNPASLSVLDNSEYLDMPQSFFIQDLQERNSLTIFDYKYNGYVSEYLDAHGFDAVFGKIPVNEMVSDMQKEVTEKIMKDSSNK